MHGIFNAGAAVHTLPADAMRIMNVLKVILETSSFIIYEQNSEVDTNVKYSGMFSVLGYKPEEYKDDVNWWINIIHPDDREDILKRFYALVPGTTNIIMNYRVQHKDGHYIYIQYRSRIEWDGEKMKNMIGCSENVTEKFQAERALLAAKDAAEAANLTKTNFLANMSHELRTPLGAIVGCAELVQDPNIEASTRTEYLATILNNSLHLAEVVSTIIDVSRIESGDVLVRQNTIDLNNLIDSIGARFTRKADQLGLTFSIGKSANVRPEFTTDQSKLRQILTSIIGNSLKFTKSGSINVALDVMPGKDHLSIQVQDTGIGIPEDHKNSVFDPYTQVDYSSIRSYSGTGLGLALARNFARLIGGDVILVHPEMIKGSLFEIQIPLIPATQENQPSSFSAARLAILPADCELLF